jgi:predicted esterase
VRWALLLDVVLAFELAGCSRRAAPDELRSATCLGPADATHFAVYLHGVDESSISEQELQNRRSLDAISRSLSLRIALPRASKPCPSQPSSLCWGWAFDDQEIAVAADAVKSAATSCFGGAHPFGLIGFSNGGYLVSKLLRTCQLHEKLPEAAWILTVGSSMIHGPLEPKPEDLSTCGRLVMLAGTEDTYNFDPRDQLLHALEAKHADVRAVRFEGGHAMPQEPTRAALAELLRPP